MLHTHAKGVCFDGWFTDDCYTSPVDPLYFTPTSGSTVHATMTMTMTTRYMAYFFLSVAVTLTYLLQ